ncbi:MAG: bifunctional 4-hydroxy-2-oxoglutarate aldolase/2-dehydro-3-deoxy-phosphogluconate aldolase [Mycobacteriales bacterium]
MTVDVLAVLRDGRLLAIVRGPEPDAALRTVLALVEEGVPAVEVSLTTSGALDVIHAARTALGPEAVLGAGTALTAADAERAVEAGAGFLVTPAVAPGVFGPAAAAGVPVLAGAFTPTEVLAAHQAGAAAVKLFPASQGGVGYLRALREPFPSIPFVPVGGVDTAAAREYLAVGALAVGVGSPLVGDAARGGDLAALRVRAREFLAAVRP